MIFSKFLATEYGKGSEIEYEMFQSVENISMHKDDPRTWIKLPPLLIDLINVDMLLIYKSIVYSMTYNLRYRMWDNETDKRRSAS